MTKKTPGSNIPSPIDAVKREARKVKEKPRRLGPLEMESANRTIARAKAQPDPNYYYHKMIVQWEINFIFSAANTGKSLFLVQIAESIAYSERVLIVDCELSKKQFQMRYTNLETGSTHLFPDNLLRAEINPELLDDINLEDAIFQSVEQAAMEGIKVICIDNLTFICMDAEKADATIAFMRKLIKLKKVYDLTLIIVAHTPKRDPSKPLTRDDLSGSSKLMALIDDAVAIGVSAKDPNVRYAKHVKFRNGEYPYTDKHVAVYRIQKQNNYTQFVYEGTGEEQDFLREKNEHNDMEDMQEFLNLQAKGLSLKQIAEETGYKKTTIHRKIKKALEMGMAPEPGITPDEELFRSTGGMEQVEQEERPSRLPFKDQEG